MPEQLRRAGADTRQSDVADSVDILDGGAGCHCCHPQSIGCLGSPLLFLQSMKDVMDWPHTFGLAADDWPLMWPIQGTDSLSIDGKFLVLNMRILFLANDLRCYFAKVSSCSRYILFFPVRRYF